jgi:chromosome partitioning protein
MITIALATQKGGVGKTTITANLGVAMAKEMAQARQKILLIDLDPQGNLTETIYKNPYEIELTSTKLFEEKFYREREIIYSTRFDNLFILPSNNSLATKEFLTGAILESHRRIKDYVDMVSGEYDYCLIDCPPSLGMFSLNALMASDYILVPMIPEKYALSGLKYILSSAETVKMVNTKLALLGILPNAVDNRYKLHREVLNKAQQSFGKLFLDEYKISTSAALKNATSKQLTIFEYDYSVSVYKQFLNLARWILNYGKKDIQGHN